MSTAPVVVIDGLSLLYRSFYALPPMSTRNHEPTSGLYGFCSVVLLLQREEAPTGFAIAIDTPGPTVRHVAYPAYKQGRSPAPLALKAQVALLPDLARAMGVPLHRVEAQEADDVVASCCAQIADPVVVVSGDTDLVQLVDDRVVVRFIGQRQRKHIRYDRAAAVARWGFEPHLLPTFKAMVGDPSDNLPGVPGIGASTAKKLVVDHGDAAGILAALDAGRIRNRRVPPLVEASREALARWEALGRLDRTLPLPKPLAAPLDRAGLATWFDRWEFASLQARL